jgi:hypothetical protein
VVVPGYWNYVHDYAFCSPHVHDVVVVHDRVPGYIVHHREQGWGARRPPDMRDIEHVSRHQIVRENDRPRGSVAPWVEHRLERGERVREHIADRGGERVIEHAGRGADQRDAGKPRDDGWRRRGDMRDDHGPAVSDRGIDGGASERGAVMQHSGNDDRRTTDPSRGRGANDRGDDDQRGYPRHVDDGDMAPRNDARGWNRPPATATDDRSAPRGHTMERPVTPPPSQPSSAYRNGGGGFERGNGGGMQHAAPPVDRGHGATAAGGGSAPTMQHGGGGGGGGDHGAWSGGHGGDKGGGHDVNQGGGNGVNQGGGNGAWTH